MLQNPGDKNLRLIVTSLCNKRCSYCCNKLPEVISRFKVVDSIKDIASIGGKYNNIAITGGEPFILGSKLKEIVEEVHDTLLCNAAHVRTHMCLYTNGVLLNKASIGLINMYINEYNIGIHSMDWKEIIRLTTTMPTYNFRFLFSDEPKYNELEKYLFAMNIKYHRYTMNECVIPSEDWYSLEEL